MEKLLHELIHQFKLDNTYTINRNIWVGHASIGISKAFTISKAKSYLSSRFSEFIRENEQTPIWIIATLKQWENIHPFQSVREVDQPLFIKRFPNGKILIAVIWPWQFREGVASILVYEGEFIEE